MREPWVDALWVAITAGCSQLALRARNHGGRGDGAGGNHAGAIEGAETKWDGGSDGAETIKFSQWEPDFLVAPQRAVPWLSTGGGG